MKSKLYLIKHQAGPVKIGISKKPGERLRAVQICCPYQLELLGTISVPEGVRTRTKENEIHNDLSKYNMRGEWFDLPDHIEEKLVNQIDKEWNMKLRPVDKLPDEERRQGNLIRSSLV